ncbi:MAG: hypothetical protein ACLFQV_01685 [Vulcanimicrobiota bacterium]
MNKFRKNANRLFVLETRDYIIFIVCYILFLMLVHQSVLYFGGPNAYENIYEGNIEEQSD